MPDSVSRRRQLAKKGQMGCPDTLNYPLDTRQHVKAAVPYYKRDNTVKCQGFWPRWCKNAKRVGYTGVPTFEDKCKS